MATQVKIAQTTQDLFDELKGCKGRFKYKSDRDNTDAAWILFVNKKEKRGKGGCTVWCSSVDVTEAGDDCPYDNTLSSVMKMMVDIGNGEYLWPADEEKKLTYKCPSYLIFDLEGKVRRLTYCFAKCNMQTKMTFASLKLNIASQLGMTDGGDKKGDAYVPMEMTDSKKMTEFFMAHYKTFPKTDAGFKQE